MLKRKLLMSMVPIALPLTLFSFSCSKSNANNNSELLKDDYKKSFDYFQQTSNKNENGFGLIQDRYFSANPEQRENYFQSNDALGFELSSYVIGAEKGWITKADALIKTKKTLNTIMNLPNYKGMIMHFVNRQGTRWAGSEYSSSTTFLIFGGMLAVQSYFADLEIDKIVENFIERIDWDQWSYKSGDKIYVRMSYQDLAGDYGGVGFHGMWDMSAEQQLLYVLYAANSRTTTEDSTKLYRSFRRSYGLSDFIQEPGGTLFTYQFSHAFLDFKKIDTGDGVDWFKNTTNAIKFDKQTSLQLLKNKFDKQYEWSWGLSANDAENGAYRVLGTNKTNEFDGWFAPWGQIASISHTNVSNDVEEIYKNIPSVYNSKFGFEDGYSPVLKKSSGTILSIDKGLELVSLSNHFDNCVYSAINQSKIFEKSMQKLGWKTK